MTADWGDRRTAFGSAAADYALGRPSYPLDAIAWVLPDHAGRVLDLAAGTGPLSEQLLGLGLDVVAVEPLADMRALIPAAAEVHDGTAEAIPLDDASVDAVLVGHAFHWFDRERAMTEIARVLRPGGRVGLFWNVLDDRDPWAGALADLINAEDRLSAFAKSGDPPYQDVAGMSEPQQRAFTNVQDYDRERLAAYVRSRSQTILMPADEREALLRAVRDLAPEGTFALPLVCEGWRGQRE